MGSPGPPGERVCCELFLCSYVTRITKLLIFHDVLVFIFLRVSLERQEWRDRRAL